MPRPKIALDEWKDEIVAWVGEGVAQKDIRLRLKERADITVSRSTLVKQLAAWDVRVVRPRYKDTDVLRSRIAEIFNHQQLTDEETVSVLESEGHTIGPQRLARVRKEMGLYKKLLPGFKPQTTNPALVAPMRESFAAVGTDSAVAEELATSPAAA